MSQQLARYDHDCQRCTFLAQHRSYDVYVCAQGVGWPTVILRHGDDGPEYHSGAHLVDDLPGPMAQAASDLMQAMKVGEGVAALGENPTGRTS